MNMLQLEDERLVSLYISGNEQAFETLLLRHKDRVYNYIYMKIRDHAASQDIFQDAFVKIVQTLKKGNYNEEGKFLSWAMRIAHNLIIDHFRKTNKVRLISESSSLSDEYNIFSTLEISDENVEQKLTKSELENQIVELLEFLPKSQRVILEQRIFKEMSFKDIADDEGISINTALGRMRYALINLRKLIDKHNIVVNI